MAKKLKGQAAAVADMLFERGAVQFGAFHLKLHEKHPGAPLSPIYLNIRAEGHKNGALRPEDFRLIASYLIEMLNEAGLEFDYLAGIPVAGEPIADMLVAHLSGPDHPIHQLHFTKLENDEHRQISYFIETLLFHRDDNRILLVDDLITKADTKLEAIDVSVKTGLRVVAVIVLVDREQGGAQDIRCKGHHVIIGFSMSALMAYYVEAGKVDRAKADEVMAYIRASRG